MGQAYQRGSGQGAKAHHQAGTRKGEDGGWRNPQSENCCKQSRQEHVRLCRYHPGFRLSGTWVVKDAKYILQRNRSDRNEQKDIDRLNAALALNHDLSVTYCLKEETRLVWNCDL